MYARPVDARTTIVAFAFLIASCGPDAIIPTPSPYEGTPDPTAIVTSALKGGGSTTEEVGVVGLPGAVEGEGTVIVTLSGKDAPIEVRSAVNGSFALTVEAAWDDVLTFAYKPDGAKAASETVDVRVDTWAAAQAGTGLDLMPDRLSATEAALSWVGEETLRFVAIKGYLLANDFLVVANIERSEAWTAQSDEHGAATVDFKASPGDPFAVFARRPGTNKTSPMNLHSAPAH